MTIYIILKVNYGQGTSEIREIVRAFADEGDAYYFAAMNRDIAGLGWLEVIETTLTEKRS